LGCDKHVLNYWSCSAEVIVVVAAAEVVVIIQSFLAFDFEQVRLESTGLALILATEAMERTTSNVLELVA
jgi:hypothetical protein